MRGEAAWALGNIKPLNEEIHMALAQALTDTNWNVRKYAARALGKIKPLNEEIHMALAKALTDTDMGVRGSAARALGAIKPKSLKVLSFITELLKNHEKNYVRLDAAWALGEIKPLNEEIHMALAQALTDTNVYVIVSVARALGKIKPKSLKVLEVIKTHNPNLHQRILAD